MTHRYRSIFLGTPGFASPVLEALHRETDVALVISQPDRPVGRGCKICKPPAKVTAESLGIEVIQPSVVKGRRFSERLAGYAPDFIVTAAFGRILGPSLFEVPKKACLNVHASLLPRHRGAAPANWTILSGDEETGVSIMRMEPALDAGPVYHQAKTAIDPRETAGELLCRLASLGAEALVYTIRHFDGLEPQAQDPSKATWAKTLKKEDGEIDWQKDARAVANHVRGMSPWPSAFTSCDGRVLKIHAAEVLTEEGETGAPGEITGVSKHGIDVVCGRGLIRITELQAPGKKRLHVSQFLAGTALNPEARFIHV